MKFRVDIHTPRRELFNTSSASRQRSSSMTINSDRSIEAYLLIGKQFRGWSSAHNSVVVTSSCRVVVITINLHVIISRLEKYLDIFPPMCSCEIRLLCTSESYRIGSYLSPAMHHYYYTPDHWSHCDRSTAIADHLPQQQQQQKPWHSSSNVLIELTWWFSFHSK